MMIIFPSFKIEWHFSWTSLEIIPSIMPVPSSKLIKVSGFPFLSLICLMLFIKETVDNFFVSLVISLINADLTFLIFVSIALTGWPDK